MDLYTYAYGVLVRKPKGNSCLEDLSIDRRISHWVSKKIDWEVMDWIQLPQNTEKCRVLWNTVINHDIQLRGASRK